MSHAHVAPSLALSLQSVQEAWPAGGLGAFAFFVAWVLVGAAVVLVFDRVLHARARRSKNPYDDIVADAIRTPLYLFLLLAGLWGLHAFFDVTPEAWRGRVDIVLQVALALTVAHAVVRVIMGISDVQAQRRPAYRGVQGVLEFLARLLVYSVAIMVVLDHLGVSITPLLGALGIAGIAVALALQDTLSNFFAGLYVTLDRPLREGDYVELDGGGFGNIKGFVVDVGWRSVRIRELSNNIYVVPNAKVASGIVKNYDLPVPEMSVVLQCSVAYGSDLAEVERVTIEVAREAQKRVQGAARTHDPFIRYHTFGDNGIGFSIILRSDTFVDQYLLTHEFVKALHARYAQEGIEIPFPQRTLHLAPSQEGGNGDAAAALRRAESQSQRRT
jgi:small-conductance mechanosensitive channel